MAQTKLKCGSKEFLISYDIFHNNNLHDIIFLHGWGSNKEIMKQAFKERFKSFRVIFIDLPGFGKSTNRYILDSYDYAEILDVFLKQIGAKKDIIAGHSFGGKIATLLQPKLLVLLSSAGIVVPKSLLVKFKIKIFKLLKYAGGKNLYTLFASKDVMGMEQNMYETFKKVVDEDFRGDFANYNNKALIFWGKKDSATPPKSGKTISKLIKNSTFYPLEGDHYFFLKNSNFIEQKVLNATV